VDTNKLDRIVQSRVFQRFWAIAGAVSIRTKVLGIVLGTVILLGIFAIVQVRRSLTDILDHDLERQGLSITSTVASNVTSLIAADHTENVAFLLQETQEHYSDKRHNTEIVYLAFTAGQIHEQTADNIPSNTYRFVAGEDHSLHWYEMGDERVLEVAERFELPDGSSGIVRLGLSYHHQHTAITNVTRQLIVTNIVMSFISIAAAVLLTWLITRPIRNLVQATQAVSQGDLTQHVTPWANDEVGRLTVAFNSMTSSLAQAAQEQAERAKLRAQFVSRVIAAQEEERRRIARELHDSTSQSLTSLLLGLQTLEQSPRTEQLRQIVSETLDEVHGLAWQLRPSVLDDLGLSAALERYIEDYQQRYTLPVDFVIHGLDDQRLPPEVETTVYRIIQEALTNVARHAQASRVSVLLEHRDHKTLVIVEDNGIGLDSAAAAKGSRAHLGLYGIRERAELLGGKLVIESEPGHGTSLFVELPDNG